MNRLSPGTSPGIFKVLTVAILSFAMLTMPLASAAAMSFRSAASTPPTKSEAKKNATSSNEATEKALFVDPPAARPAPEAFIQPVAPPPPPAVFTATLVGVLTATANNVDLKADPGDTITYTATLDNQTGSDATALSFTIPIDSHTTFSAGTLNSTPVAFDVAQTPFNEDAAAQTITLAGQDPDGSNLTFSTVTSPTKGTLGIIAAPTCGAAGCTATVSYTPTANANGSDSFTYRVNDGTANSNQTGTVSITINSVNDVPTFTTTGNPPAVNEDSGAATISGFLTSISPGPADEAGQTVTFPVTANTNSGLFQTAPAIDSTGKLTYTPALNQNGTATITYHAHDTGGTAFGGVDNSADQQFTITVNAVNDAPTVTNKTFGPNFVMANMKRTGFTGLLTGVTDVDTGVNGCSPTFSIKAGSISATSPVGGTVSNVSLANGTFDFDPPPGATGDVTFTYIVSDTGCPGTADSAPVTVTINVSGPVIWFVKPPSAAPAAGGDGRLSNPFNRMLEATTAMGTNASQRIFVYNNGFATIAGQNVTLQGNTTQATAQWLIGQGAVAASFDALMGITVPANTIARPTLGADATAANGLRPTIQGQVTMKENTRVEGFNSNVGAGLKGLTGSNWASGGAITIRDINVTSTTGNAVDFSNAALSGQTITYVSSDTANFPNSIVSTTGVALSVVNTTVGANGMTFRSISASGAVNGIVLNNTGAVGQIAVTGDGSTGSTTCGGGTGAVGLFDCDGSGGTISNAIHDAVLITNSNVTLRQMKINNAGWDGVQSTGSGNIVLSAVDINHPGNASPAPDGSTGNPSGFGGGNGFYVENGTGTYLFDNNSRVINWQASQSNAVLLHNTSANFTSFTVDHALISTSATGAAGFHANLNGTTTGQVNLTNSEFTLIDQNAAQILNNGSGTIRAIVQGNNFHDADATSGDGNNTLFLANSHEGHLNFTIGGAGALGNTFHNLARLTTLAGVIQVDAAGGDNT
ncbi:MAG: large repetitive protein, partial [Acidobacteriota bacterium]|nr:large repetitive protein [Acidobacteriota bacterium]